MKKIIIASLAFILACFGIGMYYEYGINRNDEQNIINTSSDRIAEETILQTYEISVEESIQEQELCDKQDISIYVSSKTDYYAVLNDNVPLFSDSDITTECFEKYSDLDELGRCGVAYACLGKETMPTEERGSIGSIKPSGWVQEKYPGIVNSEPPYLYNRCHLIAYMLSGENDNEKNLITGTRAFNVLGMLPFEEKVAEYIEQTGNHVLYRVVPVFDGDNLVVSGITLEAKSVEDDKISIFVYIYNVQKGIVIDYTTGASFVADGYSISEELIESMDVMEEIDPNVTYVLNVNTKRFHDPNCDSVNEMKEKNRQYYYGSREEAIAEGYQPCGICKP